ncbi:hypothetical protein QBC43DRAFT_286004 [Cladorrhinum sp. PSN259]|nr:hypothetical protein QBC43DRAFT_286004 [Cladorrhinum sp. PSN259]
MWKATSTNMLHQLQGEGDSSSSPSAPKDDNESLDMENAASPQHKVHDDGSFGSEYLSVFEDNENDGDYSDHEPAQDDSLESSRSKDQPNLAETPAGSLFTVNSPNMAYTEDQIQSKYTHSTAEVSRGQDGNWKNLERTKAKKGGDESD